MAEAPEPTLELLVLADLHYVGDRRRSCAIPQRRAHWALELAERAVRRALRQFRPDAIVLLGDLVDDGLADESATDLKALQLTLQKFDLPIVPVTGNHDGFLGRVSAAFGVRPGRIELGGYQLISIESQYDAADATRHSEADLARVASAAVTRPESPVIVLQHNPILPPILSSYSYNPLNANEIHRYFADARVVLSLSGHYHAGIPAQEHDGVCYVTAPALCEAPFRFLRVTLRGRRVEVLEQALQMPSARPLWDIHCHTHYAYCRDDVTAQGAIERARLMGLRGLVVTEHAGQLYLPQEDFWKVRFHDDPDLIRRTRHTPSCRMDAYLAEILPLRDDFIRLGVEVDSDGRGGITLLDEDKRHWDVVIGAVHWIPRFDPASATEAERAQRFMEATEEVIRAGVHVLAHPFRYFRGGNVERPRHLYRPLARLLAETGVAAEINFHTNQPDPAFFALCLEEGARIALGTDSHSLWEAGELWPHLDVLRQAGCSDGYERVLFTP